MTFQSKRKFIAVKKFSITNILGNIHVIPENAIILVVPIEGETELMEITIAASAIVCDTFNAKLNNFFPFCVKSYNTESELESSPSEISVNRSRHVQIKICETEEEANEFLANRPDTDIISVNSVVVELGQYAAVHFHIVYKTDL